MCSVQNVNILYKNTPVVFPHVYVLALMNHQIYLKSKGQCHETSTSQVFFSPSNPRPTIQNFVQKLRRYLDFKFDSLLHYAVGSPKK